MSWADLAMRVESKEQSSSTFPRAEGWNATPVVVRAVITTARNAINVVEEAPLDALNVTVLVN